MRLCRIFATTCALAGVSSGEMRAPSRDRRIARWRQAGMCVARQHGYKLAAVGRVFGRDHTTVVHAMHALDRREDLADRVRRINRQLVETSRPVPVRERSKPEKPKVAPLPPGAERLLLAGWSISGVKQYFGTEWR